MTPEQIISLAYDCDAMPECCTDKTLIELAKAIQAHTRYECLKNVQKLIQSPPSTDKQEMINDGVISSMMAIERMST